MFVEHRAKQANKHQATWEDMLRRLNVFRDYYAESKRRNRTTVPITVEGLGFLLDTLDKYMEDGR